MIRQKKYIALILLLLLGACSTNNGQQAKDVEEAALNSFGLSGNTGIAGFPHLHLVMTREMKYPYEPFPITFKNTLSNERSLAGGTDYTAYEYEPDEWLHPKKKC